jgi:hypothetical protein
MPGTNALQRTTKWLCSVAELLNGQDFSESSLQCLLGTWICERTNGSPTPASMELARTISNQAEVLSDSAILSCDSKLLLLCLGVIREYGLRAPKLEEHARKVSEALKEHGSTYRDYVGLTLALHRIGLSGSPNSAADQTIVHRPMIELLAADMNDIRDLYSAICNLTCFGTRRYPDFLRPREIKYAVSVLMTDALRNYDLSTGANLLRAAAYLEMTRDPVVENAISFLNLQQLSDGRFGQYDLLARRVREAGFDPCLQMYLPLTVSCVWSLSECGISNFRLFAKSKES